VLLRTVSVALTTLGSAAAVNQDVTGRYLGENQTSDEHFFTIQQWLSECLEHQKCTQTVSGTKIFNPKRVILPTRCIDVSGKNIILSETKDNEGSYIALSHRWNDETEGCKTTTNNYKDREMGRSFNSLPKVFKDAIVVARKLNVQYLWIDSLCIVQSGDGGRDWGREALKMAQYYQQALVVLAGTAASKELGLFSPRTQSIPRGLVRVPYRDRNGVRKGCFYVYKRENPRHYDYWTGVRNAELSTRGWVFQEWFLSRRSIYFTQFGIFFECQTDYPKNTDQEVIDPAFEYKELALAVDIKMSLNLANSNPLHLWYRVVETYSGMQLTQPQKDRILAISGIAREFRELILARKNKGRNDTAVSSRVYLSGLWLNDIHFGLLWQQKTVDPALGKVPTAPSWSWASTLAEVRWPEREGLRTNACKIVGLVSGGTEYKLDEKSHWQNRALRSDDPDDIVSAGILTDCDVDNMSVDLLVRGRLQPVIVRDYFETEEQREMVSEATGYRDSYCWQTWRSVCSLSALEFIGGWGSFEATHIQSQLSFYHGTEVIALHVSSGRSLNVSGFALGQLGFNNEVHNVLYLESVADGCYRRIGVGRVFETDLLAGFSKAKDQVIKLI
jgi:hypothetical protein